MGIKLKTTERCSFFEELIIENRTILKYNIDLII